MASDLELEPQNRTENGDIIGEEAVLAQQQIAMSLCSISKVDPSVTEWSLVNNCGYEKVSLMSLFLCACTHVDNPLNRNTELLLCARTT